MMRLFAVFLFFPFFFGLLAASGIRDWIFYEKSEQIPALAVYSERETYDKWQESMKIYRDENYLSRFASTFRIKPLSVREFLAEFPDQEDHSAANRVVFYFFDADGMLLLIEFFTPGELPGYGLFLRYEEALKEYRAFLAGEPPKRGPLFWPRRAFLSGNYPLSRALLERIKPSMLSAKERAAFYTLLEMLHRRETESHSSPL